MCHQKKGNIDIRKHILSPQSIFPTTSIQLNLKDTTKSTISRKTEYRKKKKNSNRPAAEPTDFPAS